MPDKIAYRLNDSVWALRRGPGNLESLIRIPKGAVLELGEAESEEMTSVRWGRERYYVFYSDLENKAVKIMRA